MSARLSPDGMYYWDGQTWKPTLSPDGRFRWDGAKWEPVPQAAYPAPQNVAPAQPRHPTSWTQPLQIAVVARYVAAGIYALFLPFWMGSYMTQAMQQALQRQQQAYPAGETFPPGFIDMMNSIITTSLWAGVVIGLAFTVVAVIAAIRRWTWAYYAILVLLGFTLLGTVFNLTNLAAGGALTAQQVQPPVFASIFSFVFGAFDTGLFVWMLVALVRRGPWAMVRA